MNKKERTKMRSLAEEGKMISKIMDEDFPEYDYWEIFEVVHEEGATSALGVKRTITNRLNTLSTTRKKHEREAIINEIEELVWYLYEAVKANQRKFRAIRKALDK